jgi:hypothetical protein
MGELWLSSPISTVARCSVIFLVFEIIFKIGDSTVIRPTLSELYLCSALSHAARWRTLSLAREGGKEGADPALLPDDLGVIN